MKQKPNANGNSGKSMLSRNMILSHKEKGSIFIEPFELGNLGTTSYDVRLGNNFFREQSFPAHDRKVFNPFDPMDIKKYWGEVQQAMLAEHWMKKNGPLENIKPDDYIVILEPGETILAHTIEFIGGKNRVCPEMRAKSSIGRIGITVCKCAGLGGVGFCNRWTMEITNHLVGLSVVLVVGMRVAQITFHEVDPLDQNESYAAMGGQYQNTDDTDKMIRDWKPELLLPRFNRGTY